MLMTAFHTYFPEVAKLETRTVTVQGMHSLPDGDYGFVELYCDDKKCDCRRVIINVIRSDTGPQVWATINYGWEPVGFYRRWMGNIDKETAMLIKGPHLDPYNKQTEYAPLLLSLFEKVIEDKTYIQRLQRHYAMMKGHLTPRVQTKTTEKVSRGKRSLSSINEPKR